MRKSCPPVVSSAKGDKVDRVAAQMASYLRSSARFALVRTSLRGVFLWVRSPRCLRSSGTATAQAPCAAPSSSLLIFRRYRLKSNRPVSFSPCTTRLFRKQERCQGYHVATRAGGEGGRRAGRRAPPGTAGVRTDRGSRRRAAADKAPRVAPEGGSTAQLRCVERRVPLERPAHPEAGVRQRAPHQRNRFPHLPRRRARSRPLTSGSTSRCRATRAAHQVGSPTWRVRRDGGRALGKTL